MSINQPLEFSKMRFFSKEWFISLWQGKRPLWEAWWVLGIVISLISYLFRLILPSPFNLLAIFLQIFFWVTAWRCAPNVYNNAWYYIARILIIASVLILLEDYNIF